MITGGGGCSGSIDAKKSSRAWLVFVFGSVAVAVGAELVAAFEDSALPFVARAEAQSISETFGSSTQSHTFILVAAVAYTFRRATLRILVC